MTNLSGWVKYPPTAHEQVNVTEDGIIIAPTRLGIQFSYTVPPEPFDSIGMDNIFVGKPGHVYGLDPSCDKFRRR